jgi:glycosyltransferase involved in cell wall biosynthesis
MKTWHIITCEYPPQIGGVSDYTSLLAQRLKAAGDDVHVWAPSIAGADDEYGVVPVHRWLGNFSKKDLFAAEQHMHDVGRGPRTLLVQWVPHGFGHRAMNLAFCHWLEHLVRNGDRLELMVHEPYLESGEGSWKQRLVAQVQRRMIRIVLEAASRVYTSIPAWERYLRPYAQSTLEMTWLPIPATVPVFESAATSALIRKRLAQQAVILGHLGTYSDRITSVLEPAIRGVLKSVPNSHALLLGNNSEQFADKLKGAMPELQSRITAAGVLSNEQLSGHLAACDLMLQPFPDGLTSRRTSLMNALAHGLPVVSNSGHLTEELWEESSAVAVGATGTGPDLADVCTRLLLDHEARKHLAAIGAELYRTRFDWPTVIDTLRSQAEVKAAGAK